VQKQIGVAYRLAKKPGANRAFVDQSEPIMIG